MEGTLDHDQSLVNLDNLLHLVTKLTQFNRNLYAQSILERVRNWTKYGISCVPLIGKRPHPNLRNWQNIPVQYDALSAEQRVENKNNYEINKDRVVSNKIKKEQGQPAVPLEIIHHSWISICEDYIRGNGKWAHSSIIKTVESEFISKGKKIITPPGIYTLNIGIVCGMTKPSLLIVDIDDKNGAKGLESFQKLLDDLKARGIAEPMKLFTNTLCVRTGSEKARHYYFSLPEGFDEAAFVGGYGPGIDIKRQKGYIVGAYSVHPSGRIYTPCSHSKEGKLEELPYDEISYYLDNMSVIPQQLLKLLLVNKADKVKADKKTANEQKKYEQQYDAEPEEISPNALKSLLNNIHKEYRLSHVYDDKIRLAWATKYLLDGEKGYDIFKTFIDSQISHRTDDGDEISRPWPYTDSAWDDNTYDRQRSPKLGYLVSQSLWYPDGDEEAKRNQLNLLAKWRQQYFINLLPIAKFDIEYNEPRMRQIAKMVDGATTIIQGGCGVGKTTAIVNYCAKLQREAKSKDSRIRILVLSNRISYSYNITTSYNEEKKDKDGKIIRERVGNVKNYKDYIETTFYHFDKLIVQVESLPRLFDDAESPLFDIPFDVIIVDESESVLNQLFSTTLGNKQSACINALEYLVRTSKQAIFSDAFMSTRTLLSNRYEITLR